MNLNNITPAEGSTKSVKRIGRGQGSGHGGTSTRGHKGQKSRSGYSRKIGFEGGQMPLQMRLPKRGFKNINRVEYTAINVGVLQSIVEKYNVTDFSKESLVELGIVSANEKIKILATGEITSKITVKASKISDAAVKKIEAAGGSVVSE